jgi:heat shock protein HslJ
MALSAAVAYAQPAPALTLPYVAGGHEPGWRLDIAADGRITLQADYGATTLSMPARPPEPVAGGRRYAGNADGRVLIVTVINRICQDDMTGMPRPHTVTVTVDEDVLKGCGGDPATLLRGAPWVVDDIAKGGLVDGSRVTLAFGDDGRVTGSASCNSYTAGYALSDEGLTIQKAATTRKACAPPWMKQEQAYLVLLEAVTRFEIARDGALILHAADGRTLRARR